MYEELKLDLQGRHDGGINAHGYDLVLHIKALEAIEQLELQLAERDAEIAKYRDAPVVEVVSHSRMGLNSNLLNTALRVGTKLIVKPGEQ